ncbi:osteomodulin-like [Anopheles moucheti]|uniref:osteomodulin-like n=1 Tax=Anopheles moucheti TaxID=186751 RepID=UPI0022F009B0|nr:osteomodulin-like [Anopheles moucheti]
MLELGTSSTDITHVEGNGSYTIVNLTSANEPKNYSFLTNTTEELIFDMATIDVLNVTNALSNITPWKVLISNSNVTRVAFPPRMSPSVVHLKNTAVEDVQFEDNLSLQDFRAEYTSLRVISPTVSNLRGLDILWITYSQLTQFSFDLLKNSTVSLLYLVGNRIETITISPGVVCCQSLEEIFLSDNLLKKLDFGTMAMMSNLKNVFLENNNMTDLYAHMPPQNHTQSLDALEYGSEDVFCSWRQYYIKLEEEQELEKELETPSCKDYYATLLAIHLARNSLVQVNFSAFSLMNNLNLLDLSKNQLLSLNATEGEVPIRLSELFVSNNNITDVYLRPFRSMKALYLYDNNVKELNMSYLPEELDYMNLINNPLNCEELPHKRALLPILGPYTEC